MDSKDRKALEDNTKEMKALRQAIEESNRLTSAVLKTSGKQPPRTTAEQPRQASPFKGIYGG